MTHALTSSIGRKYLMALSGIVWAGFVFGHMAGNFLLFVGPDAYNSYSHAILTNPVLLYATEILLIVTILPHAWTGITLAINNRSAKESRYAESPSKVKKPRFGSATMAFQGTLILVFIILHLSTFKYGVPYETTVDGVVMRDLHRLIIEVFQSPIYVIWYVVALVLLGVHLSHGLKSVVQSLGLRNDAYSSLVTKAAAIYGVVVAGGFIAQPLYVFFFY